MATNFRLFVQLLAVAGTCCTSDLQQMDLIDALQLHNNSYQGVTVTRGTTRLHQALELSGSSRAVFLPVPQRDRALAILNGARELTVLATLRHKRLNAATVVAVTIGDQRLMELQSSGRTGEVRFHYLRASDDVQYLDVVVESFRQRVADFTWHRLAVSVSGSRLSLYVDCRHIETRTILPLASNLSAIAGDNPLNIWLGQRNERHFLMQGALQDVRMVRGVGGVAVQCPDLEAPCPTCGQFEQLKDTVDVLEKVVHRLSDKLKATEEALKQLQLCDCQRSCRVNDTVHSAASHWLSGCSTCVCRGGEAVCQPRECPRLNCSHPHQEPGECCPSCKESCIGLDGSRYAHGEQLRIDACTTCVCRDSLMECHALRQEDHCPTLDHCQPDQRVSIVGQCCQFCRGDDFCNALDHQCHANASCINRDDGFLCQCARGLSGNGSHCEDVDECDAAASISGHQCGEKSHCINTLGSYICQCTLAGHRRRDPYTCVDVDECAEGTHGCHANATCHNKDGGFSCQCNDGFVGNGHSCQPVCSHQCENGGVCAGPGRCVCRRGYAGAACERDVDECRSGLHRCRAHPRTICVNQPGWYRCDCAAGYRRSHAHDVTGDTCSDVDECAEGIHTCHKNSACVNTLGSYMCVCYSGENCTQDCFIQDGTVRASGSTWRHNSELCQTCQCSDGVMICGANTCDCLSDTVDLTCCPQCLQSGRKVDRPCVHQERYDVHFEHGDRWLHRCHQCECLFGEIDCWPVECPPADCSEAVKARGDCCARCADDPCSAANRSAVSGSTGTSGELLPCHVMSERGAAVTERSGQVGVSQPVASGWQAECHTCQCQVPFCDRLTKSTSSAEYRTSLSFGLLVLLLSSIILPVVERLRCHDNYVVVCSRSGSRKCCNGGRVARGERHFRRNALGSSDKSIENG